MAVSHLKVLLILVFAVECFVTAHANETCASDLPELTVLKRYLGDWKVVYESEKAAFSDGTVKAVWTLDGRFLKQTFELNAQFTQPKTLRVLKLMTYDHEACVYRSWTFISNGRSLEASGKWDDETDTMTWTSRPDDKGVIHQSTETFDKDGIQKWTKAANDKGKTVGQSNGTNTRIED